MNIDEPTHTSRPLTAVSMASVNAGNALVVVYTTQQLAEMLSCSKKHIENLTAKGLLRPVRLGRCIRYRPDAVLRALESLETRR